MAPPRVTSRSLQATTPSSGNQDLGGGANQTVKTCDAWSILSILAAVAGAITMGVMQHAYLCVAACVAFQFLWSRTFSPPMYREVREGPFCVVSRKNLLLTKRVPTWLAMLLVGHVKERAAPSPLLHGATKVVAAAQLSVNEKPTCTLGDVKDANNVSKQAVEVLQVVGDPGSSTGNLGPLVNEMACNATDYEAAALHAPAARVEQSHDPRFTISHTATCLWVDIALDRELGVAGMTMFIVYDYMGALFTYWGIIIPGEPVLGAFFLFMALLFWIGAGFLLHAPVKHLLLWHRVEISLQGGHKGHWGPDKAPQMLTAHVDMVKHDSGFGESTKYEIQIRSSRADKCIVGFGFFPGHKPEWEVEQINAWLAKAQGMTAVDMEAVLHSSGTPDDETRQEP